MSRVAAQEHPRRRPAEPLPTATPPVPVAFAFQAVQLVFDDTGEFLTTQQLPAGEAAARSLPSTRAAHRPAGRGPVFLEARGAFVRLAHEEAR